MEFYKNFFIIYNKKIKKKLKEYQKNYRETKKHASQMQICQ